ncbi:hypothetical protein MGN70_003332 [Eutypa lata]|uniref:Uncharacterized protein n=1 Tax=Eutypa lata (strain UCR-EL1) TaxID=1287681 RepID=M7TA17_EUTLA|nr:hypothetical protein UCREL1_9554 [Eutypa lata UCREL1]KAI1255267.1 hypothetical protein MGN70_003332 [Eutypa lata]
MSAIRAAFQIVPRRTGVRGLSSMRQFARSFEAHPTPMPNVGALHKGDWGRIVKTRAQQAAIYFPGLAVVLGWPLACEYVLKEQMGRW